MIKKIFPVIAIAFLSFSLFAGVAVRAEGTGQETTASSEKQNSGELKKISDLSNKTIGMLTGEVFDAIVSEALPDAKITFFNSYADSVAALNAGKIDAIPADEPTLLRIAKEYDNIMIMDDTIGSFEYGFVFPKSSSGEKKLSEFNEWLAKFKESGELEELIQKWKSEDESKMTMPDVSSLPSTNGKLTMVTEASIPPFDYVRGKNTVGIDIDIAAEFCKAKGYGLNVQIMSFDGLLTAVQSGKADFAASAITITEERAESVNFSIPYYLCPASFLILKERGGAAADVRPEFSEFSELSGKTVSLLTGAPFEELVKSKAPGVLNFTYFNSTPDAIQALKTKKTDAFFMNNAVGQLIINRNPDLAIFPKSLDDSKFGIAFAKGDPRRDEWLAAFKEIPNSEIEKAWDKWTGADESVKELPAQDWPGTKGTLHVAACDTLEPMSYVGKDNEVKGFDIEIILMIAKKLDYKVEFTGMDFAAILAGVQSGKADMGTGSIVITPERSQAVDFIDYYPAAFVLVVRAVSASPQQPSFLQSIGESFEKTFVREDRWKLFVEGVLTTLVITLLAMLFGTILGFLIFMLCRNQNPVANIITKIFLWLIQGMPAVVLLMVLYFVIFGSVSISGVVVSVIGFTLTFGAAVFGLLKMGVGAIDKGQYEAAYALGYSNTRTFFKIILPQALYHVLPAYKGEVVSLIKATAIVGYIAVQDLTKMGDIVRSRTYEAFFPLIAVTIIYFALEVLIGRIISRVTININPKRRKPSKILKGVNTNDQ